MSAAPVMEELSLLISHLEAARPARERVKRMAKAGQITEGLLVDAQCEDRCETCYVRCAGLAFIVANLERDVARAGGVTINGVSYAFAGRA